MRGDGHPNVNRHHTLYERGAYQRNNILRGLRNHPGLIIPMFVVEHRSLHRALDRRPFSRRTPSVPIPDLEAAKYFVDSIATYEIGQPRLQTLEQAIGWFAMTNNEDTAEVLAQERDFIAHTTVFPQDLEETA